MAESLRIAHVVAHFPPYWSGTGVVAQQNALELARRGHRVSVLTGTMPAAGATDPPEITVHRLPTPVRIGNATLTPSLLAALRGYDVVHLHWPFMFGAELTWLACRARGLPYVITYHIDLIGQGWRAPVFAAYQALWAPRVIGDARAVFAVSQDHFASTVGAEHARRHGTRVREVPNGVDLERFSPGDRGQARARLGLPADRPLVLFVATLDQAHYYKGLSYLLRAMRDSQHAIEAVVVGDGDLRASYEAEAAELGVAERVRFAGAVGNADLPDYYRSADLTVLPSTHTESFGLVLVESLACGTPAVATDLPGVRSVVEHGQTGLLVRPHSPAELGAAIDALIGDPARREELGQNGRRKAEERYGWRRIAERLEAEYRVALEQPR